MRRIGDDVAAELRSEAKSSPRILLRDVEVMRALPSERCRAASLVSVQEVARVRRRRVGKVVRERAVAQ